jgi:hypothetical protein
MVARWPVAAAEAEGETGAGVNREKSSAPGRPESSVAKQADEWQYAMMAGFG